MPVGDLCHENLVTIESNATLLEAARLMKERHVGDLVVVARKEANVGLVGIITDRDIVMAAVDDQPLSRKRVDGIMTRPVHVLHESDSIRQATAMMREKGVRRIPVVGSDGKLLGVLTADVLQQLLSQELADLAEICDRQVAREGEPREVINASIESEVTIESTTWQGERPA